MQYDCVDMQELRYLLSEKGGGGVSHKAVIVGSVEDPSGCVSLLRRSEFNAVVLCLLDRRCSTTSVNILRSGADDVLVKPVVGAEICARIEVAYRRAHGLTSNALPVGRLTVFLDGRDPEVDGERLRLSQREHAILSVLALNHRRVVSKEHIYEAVYGLSGLEPLDKVIDVYICKLRKKIATATGGGRYIETVYGRGFKLEAPLEQAAIVDGRPARHAGGKHQTLGVLPLPKTTSFAMA
jgi:two-component system cell cycle response regulator CtrA